MKQRNSKRKDLLYVSISLNPIKESGSTTSHKVNPTTRLQLKLLPLLVLCQSNYTFGVYVGFDVLC